LLFVFYFPFDIYDINKALARRFSKVGGKFLGAKFFLYFFFFPLLASLSFSLLDGMKIYKFDMVKKKIWPFANMTSIPSLYKKEAIKKKLSLGQGEKYMSKILSLFIYIPYFSLMKISK